MGSIYQSCEKGLVYLGNGLDDVCTRLSTGVVNLNQIGNGLLDEVLPIKKEISHQKFNVSRVFRFIRYLSALIRNAGIGAVGPIHRQWNQQISGSDFPS